MRKIDRRTFAKVSGLSIVFSSLISPVAAQDDDEPDYGDWFEDVENFEETEDLTGEDEVTVDVGAGDQGLQFDPPAIRIDQGTTVVWEWTGEGGAHNVAHVPEEEEEEEIEEATGEDEPVFESEIVDEEGFTFEHDFEESGTYLYICEPHQEQGMKGAVAVDE